MNGTSAPPAWSGAEQFEQHDFPLLDFDNIDLDFDFANASANDAGQQLGPLADDLEMQHLQHSFSAAESQEHRNGPIGAQTQQNMDNMSQAGNGYFEFSMPPYTPTAPAFSQAQEHVYRPQAPVPPTPNSVEMHADPARYLQQMDAQQAMFGQRYQARKDDSFTPLVSPAVTPHEARFQIQDMTTVPGAYFSPLTSPALTAQNHSHQQAHSSVYCTTSGSSTGASPVDANVDVLEEEAASQQEQGRKLRSANKKTAPRSSAATRRVRQSPIVKPGRRKASVSSLIPPKEITDLLEEARINRPCSRESSETSSISPEPLSEMGPPPKPLYGTLSPAMLAQNRQASLQGAAPATPGSLMRIEASPTFGAPEVPPTLDELTLPEPSLDKPPLSRLDTALYNGDNDAPQSSSRKTPKLGPLSTPSAAVAQSGKPSPMLSAVSSPTSPAFAPGTNRRVDPRSARNPKKRNSTSSALVSPALRPKISPSIKPLLPEGAVSDETHALLLASKSNYQNILDGTTVPGVVYPTSLSTNLTSKRTSHKIAEQGRRNRINTALMEMQALLPSPQLGPKDCKSPESAAGQSTNSKAAKVESAIEYIKQLQKQCQDKDKLLDEKDQEVEALRKELAALRRSSISETITSNEATDSVGETSTPSLEDAT